MGYPFKNAQYYSQMWRDCKLPLLWFTIVAAMTCVCEWYITGACNPDLQTASTVDQPTTVYPTLLTSSVRPGMNYTLRCTDRFSLSHFPWIEKRKYLVIFSMKAQLPQIIHVQQWFKSCVLNPCINRGQLQSIKLEAWNCLKIYLLLISWNQVFWYIKEHLLLYSPAALPGSKIFSPGRRLVALLLACCWFFAKARVLPKLICVRVVSDCEDVHDQPVSACWYWLVGNIYS